MTIPFPKLLAFPVLVLFGALACKTGTQEKPDSQEVPGLKSLFETAFLIGAAINEGQITSSDSLGVELIQREFNSVTPENVMKWMYLHPKKGKYDFKVADDYVALGQKTGMYIIGHTLVWHNQLAPWMEEVRDSADMAALLADHIRTVVGRYKGKIQEWDVVNEALNEDGSPRESLFYKVMGQNYLEHAFRIAGEVDPDASLMYNDYNLWKPEKRAGVLRLVKHLREKGITIDGVGMQGHWGLEEPSLKQIENSIIAYSGLGVKVSVTELDITVLPNPWDLTGAAVEQDYSVFENDPEMNPYPQALPDSTKATLAKRYADVFELFLKHRDKIHRVTFWGVQDGQSWLNDWPIKGRTNYPLLFDREFRPKKAYKHIVKLKEASLDMKHAH
ncbi:MAG: endo-1,4-beta-xylanase [Bacteroidota bacterium]